MAKGLVSNSTRSQALSYTRYAPNKARRRKGRRFTKNPIGVTALAAVNGRGAFKANARARKNAVRRAISRFRKNGLSLSMTTPKGERLTLRPRGSKKHKPKVVTRTRTVTRTITRSKTKRASTRPLWITERGRRVKLTGGAARAYRERRGARLGGTKTTYKTRYGKARRTLSPNRRKPASERITIYERNKKASRPRARGVRAFIGRGTVSVWHASSREYKRLRGPRARKWAKEHLSGKSRAKFLKQVSADMATRKRRKGKPSRKASRMRRNQSMYTTNATYAENKRKAGSKKKSKGKRSRRAAGRTAPYRPLKTPHGRRMYVMRKKGGKYSHAPVYRQLGFKSWKAMGAAAAKSDKHAAVIHRKMASIKKRRASAAKKMMRLGPLVHGKHVPPYKSLGFKSQRGMAKVLTGKDRKAAERLSRRLEKLLAARRRAAARIEKHGDRYTPNAARTVPYEEWSKNAMEPNKKKGKGKRKGRKGGGWTKAKRREAAKKAAKTRARKHAARSAAAKKGARKRKGYRKNVGGYAANKGAFAANKRRGKGKGKGRKGKKLTKEQKAKMRKGWRAWYKKTHGHAYRAKSKSKGRGKRGKYKKNEYFLVPNRRFNDNARYAENRGGKMAPNRHGRRHHRYHDNRALARYSDNKAMAANRHHHRHHYRSNFGSKEFAGKLKEALKVGAIGTGGFLVHRGLSYYLSENLLTKIGFFQDATTTGNTPGVAGGGAPYRSIAAGALVAIAGIPLAEKVAPKAATPIAAGMVVSFLHQLIVTALRRFQPTLVPAISGYGDNPGQVMRRFRGGYGEYFATPGMGEYFRTGMGAYGGGVRQAAAGFGASPYMQAAAGFGAMQRRGGKAIRPGQTVVSQAAAGFGAPPMLTQAAAGVGEFFLANPQGIGDYEQVSPPSSGAMNVTDEGIPGGDTHAAEHALSIAEAASGIGGDDGVGVQSIVDPIGVAVPINDEPGGERAGLFAGSEGIFG